MVFIHERLQTFTRLPRPGIIPEAGFERGFELTEIYRQQRLTLISTTHGIARDKLVDTSTAINHYHAPYADT